MPACITCPFCAQVLGGSCRPLLQRPGLLQQASAGRDRLCGYPPGSQAIIMEERVHIAGLPTYPPLHLQVRGSMPGMPPGQGPQASQQSGWRTLGSADPCVPHACPVQAALNRASLAWKRHALCAALRMAGLHWAQQQGQQGQGPASSSSSLGHPSQQPWGGQQQSFGPHSLGSRLQVRRARQGGLGLGP